MATGCFWIKSSEQRTLWKKTLKLILNSGISTSLNGNTDLIRLGEYPGLLLLYAGGLAAIANDDFQSLATLIYDVKIKSFLDQPQSLSDVFYLDNVLEPRLQKMLPTIDNNVTPLSNRINKHLQNIFTNLLPQDDEYQNCFDRFEYLFALIQADRSEKAGDDFGGQPGRFIWRRFRYADSIINEIEKEAKLAGNEWAPLKAGIFDGKMERFFQIKEPFDKRMENHRFLR